MADFLNTLTLSETDREATVTRLRESKLEYEKGEAEDGRREGIDWAKTSAEYRHLKTLAEADLSLWWDSLDCEDGKFAEWLDGLLGMENPESIFSSVRDDGQFPSDEYASAFVAGATEVWNEVAGEL